MHDSHILNTKYVYEVFIMATKSVSIRIEEEMLRKIGYIAEYEGRSVNSHILVLVRESIKRFEEEHGAIEGDVTPAENVKPKKK